MHLNLSQKRILKEIKIMCKRIFSLKLNYRIYQNNLKIQKMRLRLFKNKIKILKNKYKNQKMN